MNEREKETDRKRVSVCVCVRERERERGKRRILGRNGLTKCSVSSVAVTHFFDIDITWNIFFVQSKTKVSETKR